MAPRKNAFKIVSLREFFSGNIMFFYPYNVGQTPPCL